MLALLAAAAFLVCAWAPFFWCCCSTCSATITFTVTGCFGLAVSGASVNVTGPGGYNTTLATNGSGVAVFTVTVNGTYSHSVSQTGYTTGTGTVVIASCANATKTVALVVTALYTCTADTCCPWTCSSPPCPKMVYPATLTLNDGTGNITLTKPIGSGAWSGSTTRTAAFGYDCATGPPTLTASLTVPVYVSAQCVGSQLVFNVWLSDCTTSGTSCSQGSAGVCGAGPFHPSNATTGYCAGVTTNCMQGQSSSTPGGCPPSYAGSFSLGFASGSGFDQVYGVGTFTWTWTQ